jgi:hypothetical protein
MGILAAAILAAVWFLLVTPERKKIAGLNEKVASAQQQLVATQSKLDGARSAQASYQTDYASLVRLGEAVPSTAQVPSLVYELDQLSNAKDVDFNSITSSGSSAAATAATASSTTGSAIPSAGFTQLPFTFTFSGSFFDLSHLLSRIDGLAVQTEKGEVQISGRLLTIQSANLAVSGNGTNASTKGEAELTGTITATAYVLPASEGLTGGATSAGPAGTSATTPQATSTAASNGSTAPAAVVKVTP